NLQPVLRQFFQYFQLDADLIIKTYRPQEVQLLAYIDSARPGQLAGDRGGDERARQHAVGDAALERGGLGKLLVEMHRIHISRNSGKQNQVPFADDMADTGGVAYTDFIVGAVF